MSASFMTQHKWPRYSGNLEKLFDDKGIVQTTSIRIFGLTNTDADDKIKQTAIKESIGKYFDDCGKISRIDIVKKGKKGKKNKKDKQNKSYKKNKKKGSKKDKKKL